MVLRSVYFMVKFRIFIPELWDFIHQIVRDFNAITIWWIKSHNSGMKNRNFTKKYTDRKTINSNNRAKFEVNWPRGSQFTAQHMKNHLQFDESSPITLECAVNWEPLRQFSSNFVLLLELIVFTDFSKNVSYYYV
jgi:hypothetical protein